MKELSIEEKARRYDEAKLRISAAYNNNRCTIGFMNEIFPELKESKGEKTKRILHSISSKMSFHLRDIFTEEEFQCFDAWSHAWLEKQGEQKLADKVEPKFHEGDWITDGNITIQIEAIKNNCYLYCGDCALYSTKTADKVYHLWTIQDAKDGDILAVEPIEGYHSPFVAIYKKQNEEDFDSYCFIGFDDKFYKGETGHSTEDVHPATKEQCDLLFQKMKEAGYEWDAEKKELKKVEQNPAEWSEEDEDAINMAVIALEDMYSENEPETTYAGYSLPFDKAASRLKSLKERVQPQLKQEWSVEDERMLDEMHKFFDTHKVPSLKHDMNDYAKFINRLKSIRDRVLPKQEWSEEDKNMLQSILDEYKSMPIEKRNWLKSLKPQSKWKPSDEQMKALEHAINCYSCISPTNTEEVYTLEIMKEQLKKLREE